MTTFALIQDSLSKLPRIQGNAHPNEAQRVAVSFPIPFAAPEMNTHEPDQPGMFYTIIPTCNYDNLALEAVGILKELVVGYSSHDMRHLEKCWPSFMMWTKIYVMRRRLA
jgi:hypothetical protein